MKKIVFLIGFAFSVSAFAYGVLESDHVKGMKRVCIYSDGTALSVDSTENCPVSVD